MCVVLCARIFTLWFIPFRFFCSISILSFHWEDAIAAETSNNLLHLQRRNCVFDSCRFFFSIVVVVVFDFYWLKCVVVFCSTLFFRLFLMIENGFQNKFSRFTNAKIVFKWCPGENRYCCVWHFAVGYRRLACEFILWFVFLFSFRDACCSILKVFRCEISKWKYRAPVDYSIFQFNDRFFSWFYQCNRYGYFVWCDEERHSFSFLIINNAIMGTWLKRCIPYLLVALSHSIASNIIIYFPFHRRPKIVKFVFSSFVCTSHFDSFI